MIDVRVEHTLSFGIQSKTNCVSTGTTDDSLTYRMVSDHSAKLAFKNFSDLTIRGLS
jgi:hypothetical protein